MSSNNNNTNGIGALHLDEEEFVFTELGSKRPSPLNLIPSPAHDITIRLLNNECKCPLYSV